MFLLLALLLLLFLPAPWNLAAALTSGVLGAIEVLYWERRMRGRKVRTGVDELLGATGEVTAALHPLGQVRVRGELWEAHSPTPINPGARVRVIAVEDLRLEVRPAENPGGTRAAGSATLLIVLALAGCGGDDGSSASEDYANSVCSNLSTWVTDVEDTVNSLTDAGRSVQREDVEDAVNEVRDSTDTLVNDLEDLGPPDTDEGREAKSQLDTLANTLRQQITTVDQALDSGGNMTAIAATVTTAISAAANAVNTTYEKLQQLDPAGELQDAFENADDCKSLGDQLEQIRS
jgi:membrane protein implicated in regulation of membrane protease activity